MFDNDVTPKARKGLTRWFWASAAPESDANRAKTSAKTVISENIAKLQFNDIDHSVLIKQAARRLAYTYSTQNLAKNKVDGLSQNDFQKIGYESLVTSLKSGLRDFSKTRYSDNRNDFAKAVYGLTIAKLDIENGLDQEYTYDALEQYIHLIGSHIG